jgi:N-methylhydantoinase A
MLRAGFEALYQQRYGAGTSRRETPLEIISFRAEAAVPTEKPAFAPLFQQSGGILAIKRRRPVYARGQGWIDAAVHAFADLPPEVPIPGPAVIERESTTIWLPRSTQATLDRYGNLAIAMDTTA